MTTDRIDASPPIAGLYEAHLPAYDLDRAVAFYDGLGLNIAYRNERVAFVWTEPGRSWVGIWTRENGAPRTHIAFEVPLSWLPEATEWLRSRDIKPVEVAGFVEPQVRPYQANASVYFDDPFGNRLEFICTLPVEPTPERGPDVALSAWLGEHPEAPTKPVETGTQDDKFITGLNEAHLPVDNLEEALAFYDHLGMSVAWQSDSMAFVWVEPGRSWLGLWENGFPEYHIAFEVSLSNLARSERWFAERGIELREVSGFTEPFVRPHQPIGSAYFSDSEDNDVELMSVLPVEPTDEQAKVPLQEWLSAQKRT